MAFCPWLFSHSRMLFKVHLSCCMYQNFIPFYGQIIVHSWIYHVMFIHSSLDGHLSSFHYLAIKNHAGINIFTKCFFDRTVWSFNVSGLHFLLINLNIVFYMVKISYCWFLVRFHFAGFFDILVLLLIVWSVHFNLVYCLFFKFLASGLIQIIDQNNIQCRVASQPHDLLSWRMLTFSPATDLYANRETKTFT